MVITGWRFPKLDHGSKQGFTNSGVETFRGKEYIENLAREICQNSLDAKSTNSEEAVHVIFELKQVDRNDSMFDEMQNHILLCEQSWDKPDFRLKSFLTQSKKILSSDEIDVLIARDFNTTGLLGAQDTKNSQWIALVRSTGYSPKDENSAGSYGIGKNAPFACSSLSSVFYNTLAEDGGEAFQGVFKFASHIVDGVETQGEGYYCIIDEIPRPIYPSDPCSFRDKLEIERDQTGTDIIILGFDGGSNWKESLIITVLKNFFVAIHEKRLIVTVEGMVVKKENLQVWLNKFKGRSELKGTFEYYETFTSQDSHRFQERILKESNEEYDAEIYLKEYPESSWGLARFRQTGMLIKAPKRKTVQRFAAVLIIRGQRLGTILRSSEPPAHNDWDAERPPTTLGKKNARNAIRGIDDWVKKILAEHFEKTFDESLDSGMGDYLPAESGNSIHNLTEDTDIMNIDPKIKNTISRPVLNNKTAGDKSQGSSISGHVNGDSTKSIVPKPRPLPNPVKPHNDEKDIGVSPDAGDKKITFPIIKGQRVFSPDLGIYNVYFKSEKSYSNVYVYLKSVGEDGSSEDVEIISCTDDSANISYSFAGPRFGPFSLDENISKNIKVKLNVDEKLCLKLVVTEEQ